LRFFDFLQSSKSYLPVSLLASLVAVFVLVERDVLAKVRHECPDANLEGLLLKKREFSVKAHKQL